MAIARTFAALKDYSIDGNKELLALGSMNIVGSLTSCYVATGTKILHFYTFDQIIVKTILNCFNLMCFQDHFLGLLSITWLGVRQQSLT